MPRIPDAAPSQITAGDTLAWRFCLADFPHADGWTVAVTLRGETPIVAEATPDPDAPNDPAAYVVTFPASTTTALLAGAIAWVATATKGDGEARERYTVGRGQLLVRGDPGEADETGGLSRDERELRTVDALIDKLHANPNQSYTVQGVTATRHDLETLYKRQAALRSRVDSARRRAKGRSLGRPVGVSFRRG